MPAALKVAAAARTAEANGEEPQYVGYMSNSPAEFTETTPTIMKKTSDYYMIERCQYPTAVNKMAVQSLDRLAAFDAFQFLDTVSPRPILLIVGSLADTIFFSQEALRHREGAQGALCGRGRHTRGSLRQATVR